MLEMWWFPCSLPRWTVAQAVKHDVERRSHVIAIQKSRPTSSRPTLLDNNFSGHQNLCSAVRCYPKLRGPRLWCNKVCQNAAMLKSSILLTQPRAYPPCRINRSEKLYPIYQWEPSHATSSTDHERTHLHRILEDIAHLIP